MIRASGTGSWRDLPNAGAFALVAPERGALRIHAANGQAFAGGVRRGQALADARAVLPSLATRPAEPERDHAALVALARWAGRYGPQRHIDGVDGLWIDVTGVAHLYGGEERFAGDLYHHLARLGFTSRVALAGTIGAAHAFARFATSAAQPVRCVASTGQGLAGALAPLPVAALRLEHDAVVLACRLGLKHIGQLYGLPRESLARRFRSDAIAEALLARLDAALGRRAEPRAGLAGPPQRTVMRNFAEPLISADGIAQAAGELAHEIAAVMEAQAVGVRRCRLRLSRLDGSAVEIGIGTAAPVKAAAHLMDLLAARLDNVDAGFGVDAMHLEVLAVEPLGGHQAMLRTAHGQHDLHGQQGQAAQTSLAGAFSDPAEKQAALARLADRLANRLGSDRVTTLASAPRHIPEHAGVLCPLLASKHPSGSALFAGRAETGLAGAGRRGVERGNDAAFAASHAMAARPALLLDRPEPITVMAEVPDGPPLRFTWRRVEHRVVAAEGPERIAPAWWRALPRPSRERPSREDTTHAKPLRGKPLHGSPSHAGGKPGSAVAGEDPAAVSLGTPALRRNNPRTRDYYRIEDHEGGRYWVFRDGLYGDEEDEMPGWFLHGVFT